MFCRIEHLNIIHDQSARAEHWLLATQIGTGERGISHRLIESLNGLFGLEGTLYYRSPRSYPPCHGQGHLSPDQVAQRPIQPSLEHCQGGGATTPLGSLLQCLTALTVNFLVSNFSYLSPSLLISSSSQQNVQQRSFL